jgi:TonB-linked SusC/RagA family outer membrane protein
MWKILIKRVFKLLTTLSILDNIKAFMLLVLLNPLQIIMVSNIQAQETKFKITGTVTSATDKSPVPGASVVIFGTPRAVLTDMNGNFTIDAASTDVLIISFVGYKTEKIPVGTSTNIAVSLSEDIQKMDEVVVVGYGVQKKSDVTGAIASVSGDQIVSTPNDGLVQALQGRAAGVQVSNVSGMPGASIVVNVRGINSINSGAGPTFIIDGVPGDINSLNPTDIESVEVLKDASSQAIYGSSGGNGVILVTTKKGSMNEKTTTTVSMYRGLQMNDINVKMANTSDWINIYNNYLNTPLAQRIKVNPDTLPNTNWWNTISHQAIMEDYNFATTTGTKNSALLFSLGYLNQDGIVDKTGYQRYTMRVNSESKLSERIKIGENLNLSATHLSY